MKKFAFSIDIDDKKSHSALALIQEGYQIPKLLNILKKHVILICEARKVFYALFQ